MIHEFDVCLQWLQIGFFALIAVEFIAHRGLLEMMGLTIGNGLPFEF